MAVAGSAMLLGVDITDQKANEALAFRAVAGLPSGPIPSYASYVIEGGVNLATKTGVITTNVFAGHPEAISNLTLPGLTRTIRVTHVETSGNTVKVSGEIMDPSTLLPNESTTATVVIDRSTGTAKTEFLGNQVELKLT